MGLNYSVYNSFVDIHLLIEYNRYYWLEYRSMNTCIDPLSLVMAYIKYTCHKNKVFLHTHTYHSLKKILEQESLC